MVHKEFVPLSLKINQPFYIKVMRSLKKDVGRKHPNKMQTQHWLQHHDNTVTHSVLTVQKLMAENTTVVPHFVLPQPSSL